MKRLLIVSDPPAAPGYLPRVRFLCDYLVRKGFDVTLLTEEYQPLSFVHSYPIKTIRMYSGGTVDWFCKTVWTLLSDWHNRVFANHFLQQSGHTTQAAYDLVICSAFSDFPLGAALRIAQAFNVPLICDIRDLDEQVDNSRYQYRHRQKWLMPFRRLYRAIHIRRRNKVLRAADSITTVSPWHADFIRQFNPNVHVLYNGFDAVQFYPENIPVERFTITYIGSLFEWQQPALKIVKQAIRELNNPDIHLEIHTPHSNPIPHDQLGDAIRRSSIMLVLTAPNTHGMLTTKFYEALGCAKPILCVPSDYGSLAELIQYTNAGLAGTDVTEVMNFIIDKYHEWQKNGFTRQPVKNAKIFTRQFQSEQIEKLL